MTRFNFKPFCRLLACCFGSVTGSREEMGGTEPPVPAITVSPGSRDQLNNSKQEPIPRSTKSIRRPSPSSSGYLSDLGTVDDTSQRLGISSPASTRIASSNASFPDQPQDDETASALFRQNEPVSDESVGNALKTTRTERLREELGNAQLEPGGDHRYFIPVEDFQRLVTTQSIAIELRECDPLAHDDLWLQQKADQISAVAPRLFATLVLDSKGDKIQEFLNAGIDDSHLPLVRLSSPNRSETSTRFRLCSKKTPDHPLECMSSWSKICIQRFAETQHCMSAPTFEFDDDIQHYEFGEHVVLPFIEDYERRKSDNDKGPIEGGYGSVWKVAIHPAHQKVSPRREIKGRRSTYASSSGSILPLRKYKHNAIKRLNSTNEESFKSEVAMLRAFKKYPHQHLVDLLATYKWKGMYHLIFPFAELNLREYWKTTPLPEYSEKTVFWILRQCRAITSGLHLVHEYRYTQAQETESEEGRKFGRHGDIKAENMLWFSGEGDEHGILVIADFGLTDFHNRATRSGPAKSITGSPSYEPPELVLFSRISRAYDIWSLGCMFLEFATWLVGGQEALDKFAIVRLLPGTDSFKDDTFFTIVGDDSPGNPRTAIVRESVQTWIHDLHQMPRCSAFVNDLLNLISEQMLVIDPKKRIAIKMLNDDLDRMVSKATKSPWYLTLPRPSKSVVLHPSSLLASRPPSTSDGTPLPKNIELSETCSSPRIQASTLSNISRPTSLTTFWTD